MEEDINFSKYVKELKKSDVVFEDIQRTCQWLSNFINEMLPDCREKSLAITKLEEAVMWSKSGIEKYLGSTDRKLKIGEFCPKCHINGEGPELGDMQLKYLMTKYRVKNKEVASYCGVTVSCVGYWRVGKRKPSEKQLEKMRNLFEEKRMERNNGI